MYTNTFSRNVSEADYCLMQKLTSLRNLYFPLQGNVLVSVSVIIFSTHAYTFIFIMKSSVKASSFSQTLRLSQPSFWEYINFDLKSVNI